MSAFTLSLVGRNPATVEAALDKIYLPALTLPALLFHKALVAYYADFAKTLREDEVIKYFVKLDANGVFTEALSIEDGGEVSLLMSQCTPSEEEINHFARDKALFQPSYIASVAVMHALLSEQDRNVCYSNQKLGLLKTASAVLMNIDKTHRYSVMSAPGDEFVIQGIGPDFMSGPYFLLKTRSWSNVTLRNYAKHNSPFHPNAVSEAVH